VIRARGPNVTLRGFERAEIDAVLPRVASAELTVGDEAGLARKRARLERSGERTEVEIWLAIEAHGRLIGDVQGRCSDMSMPTGVWELGIELWDESDRGRGFGRESCELLTSHLFDVEGAIRVQASTDVDNTAMRRTLESIGFSFEGVLRGFMPQPEGDPRDFAMYAMTEKDHRRDGKTWIRTD